ncbi:FAD-dependent oxidoreductase [Elusimicrobiota bacterium]
MDQGFSPYQAIAEADRCLLCYDAPCSKGCPSDTDPGTFIRKLKLRNLKGAINTIKENNILGGVCGALCPAADLCEKECAATSIDRPIQIAKLQRFLIEYGRKLDFRPLSPGSSIDIKAAVIGSGPSGLSCAAELAKNGCQVDVFEKKDKPGGMLRYLIPDYRLSNDFLDSELDELTYLGVNIICNSPITSKEDMEDLLNKGYEAIYIATGTWEAQSMGLESDFEGFYYAHHFLEKCKAGEKTEIKNIIKDKTVCVIGGGDTAINTAEVAKSLGAKDVSVIYRRSFVQMPGNDNEKTSALNSGINFLFLTQPVNYLSAGGKITGIEVIRNKLGDPDSSGRPRPVPVESSNHVIDTDIVIEAIGLKPDPANNQFLSDLELSDRGLIIINDETGITSRSGIYAGGDITRGPALIAEAVADGKRAAKAILKGSKTDG